MNKPSYKVFVQEDNKEIQKRILDDYKDNNYRISFFSKSDSAFDLLNFNPDILIQDYLKNKIVNCFEWSTPYNN
jgi:DNA-binding response OmpR family regulator